MKKTFVKLIDSTFSRYRTEHVPIVDIKRANNQNT